ncbi:HNH endonuclease [Lederbergia ruris]|uniref:HNH endonuclease n=1 Tax=Lederbergia ruris TaxID=217495 RepID=UPI001BB38522|nr:HNH endonuclease [Lederbergia ruris]
MHCLQDDKFTKADVVDHIIPIIVDWSRRLDDTNCQSLCHGCHNVKSAEDRKKYGTS